MGRVESEWHVEFALEYVFSAEWWAAAQLSWEHLPAGKQGKGGGVRRVAWPELW